jgi:AMMECR1 domain-containing protein
MRADLSDKRKLLARKEEELSEMRRMKNELQAAAADNCQAPVLQQQLREMQVSLSLISELNQADNPNYTLDFAL